MRPEENQGFTLIELLVVLAVVGLMMGVIGFSLLGGGGAELDASQRNVLGVLHQARTIAASTGVVTRIIINADPEDEEKFFRHIEIISKDTNQTDSWIVKRERISLNDGVYFVPNNKSLSFRAEGWRTNAFCSWSGGDGEFNLSESFKGKRVKSSSGTSFKFIEFDGSGNLRAPDSISGGIPQPLMLVLALGSPNPANTTEKIRFNDPNNIAGILLRNFGGFAVLEISDFDAP
jgi:prepilin-type N-terminal cleavage/methylation domain-containing protein